MYRRNFNLQFLGSLDKSLLLSSPRLQAVETAWANNVTEMAASLKHEVTVPCRKKISAPLGVRSVEAQIRLHRLSGILPPG